MAPGLAGMDICTWKRRRAASVASTFSLTGVCACSGKETSERRATAEIRIPSILSTPGCWQPWDRQRIPGKVRRKFMSVPKRCLLYTSDAADDLLCVDLGGRRIIKK